MADHKNSNFPKISSTDFFDKMVYANSVSQIRVYIICHSTMYFIKQMHRNKNLSKITKYGIVCSKFMDSYHTILLYNIPVGVHILPQL